MINIIPLLIRRKILEKLDLYENRAGLGTGYLNSIKEIFKRDWKYSIILILATIIECIVNIPFLIIKLLCYIPYKLYDRLWN